MENLLTISIAITAAAVVLQAGILVAMYLAVRKSTARMESLAAEVKTKVLPTVEVAHSMLVEMRPKIEVAVENVSEASTLVRSQIERRSGKDAAVDNRYSSELRCQLGQSPVESVSPIACLLERRTTDRFRIPAVAIEGQVFLGLDLQAKNAAMGVDDDEVDLGSQSAVPGSQIQGMQCHPIVRSGGK